MSKQFTAGLLATAILVSGSALSNPTPRKVSLNSASAHLQRTGGMNWGDFSCGAAYGALLIPGSGWIIAGSIIAATGATLSGCLSHVF